MLHGRGLNRACFRRGRRGKDEDVEFSMAEDTEYSMTEDMEYSTAEDSIAPAFAAAGGIAEEDVFMWMSADSAEPPANAARSKSYVSVGRDGPRPPDPVDRLLRPCGWRTRRDRLRLLPWRWRNRPAD